MRVIAGAHRGKKLLSLGDAEIRPTSDRVKESVFQILTPYLAGARVLDLFCGSGALAIESLSRGAREAVLNDHSRTSLAVAEKNLRAVRETAQMTCLDFRACLARADGKFDVIFVDPPYREDFCGQVLGTIRMYQKLNGGGVVVYESEREELACEGWFRADFREYGRTKVAFFTETNE